MVEVINTSLAPDEGIAADVEFIEPESKPFLGIIVADGVEQSVLSSGEVRKQWHLAVRPVEYEIGGQSGAFHKWMPYKAPPAANSLMAKVIDSLRRTVGVTKEDGSKTYVCRGELVGTVAHFIRKSVSYGKRDGAEIVSEGVIFFVDKATAEEAAKARSLPPHIPVQATGEGAQPITAAPMGLQVEFTPEQVASLVTLFGGRSPVQAIRDSLTNDDYKDLRAAVSGGTALAYLQDAGLVALVAGRVEVL